MESDEHDARTQLAALRSDRAALADRVLQPWWWDVALGALVFLFFGSYATRNWLLIAAALAVFLLGIYGLVTYYRRRTGLWPSADRPGLQPLLRLWLACCVAWAVAAGLGMSFAMPWLVAGVSAACGVVVTVLSRRSGQLFVAQLRGEL
ncbi:hypothetical protein [Blastococcus xanthinilyticus]|nr:hypothetical protein [Blastococcus xanthinilyticus]